MILAIPKCESSKAINFAKEAAKLMSKANPHGLGIAALQKNKLAVQKWLYNENAFKKIEIHPKLAGLPLISNIYKDNGIEVGNNASTILLHARYSTNTVCIENTHPFFNEELAIIHNGVVSCDNKTVKNFCLTDNDSEFIFQSRVLRANELETIDNIQKHIDDFSGSYAIAALQKFNKIWFLDIYKNQSTKLFCGYVQGVGIVYLTSDTIIKAVASKLGLVCSEIFAVKPNIIIRYNLSNYSITTKDFIERMTFPKKITPFSKDNVFLKGFDER